MDDQTFRAGRTILSPVVLPAAVGGIGALTYSLSPDVPGLTFDADTRTLSGTPTTADTYAMTYSATDNEDRTARLHFTITIDPYSAVRALVSEITAGRSSGVPRLEDVPEPNGGPAVSVSGSEAFVVGGAVFLNVRPVGDGAIDKLLVSIGGESFGYYEVDLQDTASSYRLVGHVPFDLDPSMLEGCVAVSAVDSSGAVGAPDCHPMYSIPVNFADVQVTVSWDSAADLDLHVADPAGAEVYYGRPRVASGGALDLAATPTANSTGPETVAATSTSPGRWDLPPPGIYEVRVSHWKSCGAHATSYVVSIYNHGRTSTFSGSFTGPGDDDDGRVIGRVITLFQVGDDPAPERAPRLSSSYRGSGDQVFVLNNPNGEVLDDTLYTLDLGNALAEVYVVGTAGNYHVDPEIERLDLREAVAKGRRAAVLQDPDHPATRRSAERLIFFMDSALFAIPEGLTWEVTDYRPSQVIGILAHEFQHMIHFYQKRVLRGVASPTWLNEMASEVAVDLIAEQMMLNGPRAVAYDDPTAGSPDIRTGRLPIYNLFNDVPVTAWYSKIANYAINYALGAYLARTYGGAELFSEIVQRDESGIDAIDAALQALGHDVSFAEVLADWGRGHPAV